MRESGKPNAFMEAQELREKRLIGERVVIVDVRSAEEFAAGHVDGAIHMPADQLAARSSELPRDATIVTVCNHGGSRSCKAAEELRGLGHNRALPLRGGTSGWLSGKN